MAVSTENPMAMLLLREFNELTRWTSGFVLAAGVFDGVHRGHRAVLEAARRLAQSRGPQVASGVLTFQPHPVAILRPERTPKLLTPGGEKHRLFAQLGFDFILELPFTQELARLSAGKFLESLRAGKSESPLYGLCCGEDWTFGRDRSGNLELLQQESRRLQLAVRGIAPVLHGGLPISSSRIRQAVAHGDFTLAQELLGRPYELEGTVVAGRKLGRQLGTPTANLRLPAEKALPPNGVYAVRLTAESGQFDGVANLGFRPTVESPAGLPTLEVHLFEFSGELYGQTLRVVPVHFLRPEQSFASLEDLQEQIRQDCLAARERLKS